MLNSLELINTIKRKKDIPQKEQWLKLLKYTEQKAYNLKNLEDLSQVSSKLVYEYVVRTLEALESNLKEDNYTEDEIKYVEDTLKWSEVSKCGNKTDRKNWQKNGYDLYVHNLASAEIYKDLNDDFDKITYILIKTHGMIGQYVKGEVNIEKNSLLTSLIENKDISKEKLRRILTLLNKCILEGVNKNLYIAVKESINDVIEKVVVGNYHTENYNDSNYIINRMKKIFKQKTEDDFEFLEKCIQKNDVKECFEYIFKNFELWYIDSALEHFSMEEIIKILMIVAKNAKADETIHINFELIMNDMYYMYNGIKVKNLYKLRIIESYLESITIEDIIQNNIKKTEHICINFRNFLHTLRVRFKFSIQAQKLIEFCEVAYGSNEIYNQAVFMLYDLFGFRRDAYDRFYNEITYLNTMNSTINYKAVILDYITGKSVLDVGPGGGALLDLIENSGKAKRVIGIDISQNVIEELTKKKNSENRKWEIIKGDALNLKNYFKVNEIDTIIFCSVLHELFSYIEMDGKKFNHKTVELAMKSCFDVLPKGGRIIIRDGIMSEN